MAETHLITNKAQLAAAHGPGVDVAADPALGFLNKGATFTKYHRQSSLLSSSAKRFLFYQHNHLFFTKPNTSRPIPGEENRVDSQYQTSLTDITDVIIGKSATTFKSRAASNVSNDRAWSILVKRKSGEIENIDFEAATQQERDAWTTALKSLVTIAKASKADHETAIRVVSVKLTVNPSGDVAVVTEPINGTETSSVAHNNNHVAAAAAATGAAIPLAIQTAAQPANASADDDTPTDEEIRAAQTISVAPSEGIVNTANSHSNTIVNNANTHTSSNVEKTVIANPIAGETARLDTPTPTVVTITNTGDSVNQQRILTLENENLALKTRIAELEKQLRTSKISY